MSLSAEMGNLSRCVKKEEMKEDVKIKFDLENQDRNEEQLLTLTSPKVEKSGKLTIY